MHYVNCVQCDAYYSQDGNPFYYNDLGDMICESCAVESLEIEKDSTGNFVTYTVSSEAMADYLDEECYEIGCKLKRIATPFTVHIESTQKHIFTIAKEHVTLSTLTGVDIDDLFYR
jgi:hypothetical protein